LYVYKKGVHYGRIKMYLYILLKKGSYENKEKDFKSAGIRERGRGCSNDK